MHGIGKQKEKKHLQIQNFSRFQLGKFFLLKYIYYKNLTEFGNRCRSTPDII